MPRPLTVWITINWKILKETGIPDHLTCLLRKLYTGQEAPVRTEHVTRLVPNRKKSMPRLCIVTLFVQCICSVYHEKCWAVGSTSWNQDCWENLNNFRYADDTILMAEREEELKSFLMKVKEEWKSWFKTQHSENEDHGIWSHHFMANGWETVETVTDFSFGGSKITADGDCSHEIKRHLLLGSKAVTNLDSILKSRDITLPTKVCLVNTMVFPVVMCGCESWSIR